MDDNTETPSAGAASATRPPETPPLRRHSGALSRGFAGLQAGMLGAIWTLAWLGIDSSWDRRGFWNSENLFATAFYGDDALRAGFSAKTLPGLALFLIIYSLLGCLFAVVVRDQIRPMRMFLAAMIFALGWFYFSFHGLWRSAMPLVYLLYADRPMVVGHIIYGACLARFPSYLPGAGPPAAPPVEPATGIPTLQTPPAEFSQLGKREKRGGGNAALFEMPQEIANHDAPPADSSSGNPTAPQTLE